MIQLCFSLNINLYSPRPIFKANINGRAVTCMLDTGADIPVFCKGTELFYEWGKNTNGITIFRNLFIGGFGKESEDTVLYHIPEFRLSDGEECITYRNMKMAVLLKPRIPCDIILSASLFMKMKYTIDCLGEQHFLNIESEKNQYGVGFFERKETIYIFSDEEGKPCRRSL